MDPWRDERVAADVHRGVLHCRLYQKVEAPPDHKRKVLGLAGRLLNELGLSDQVCGMEKPPALAPAAQQLRLSI